MKRRICLKGTVMLSGESESGRFLRAFYIDRKISEGASGICYEAHYKNSGRGVLKEFYPSDIFSLKRAESGHLILPASESNDARARFQREKEEYLVAYQMLLSAKQSGKERDLATFIPAFEIYQGCSDTEDDIGTIYIWTPEAKLEPFDKVCDEIHKYPAKAPEHKLFTVLTAIQSLTKCVRALHSADLIHRDIKPSNFGFLKRGDETLTQTLSMFDIDSVCSVFGDIDDMVGTRGYMEPESEYEEPNNQTDIYSIGATLFHAIIVTEETREGGFLFRPEFYGRLRELVDESSLIRASEANSNPKLRKMLTMILSRCLCDRTHRYANCEELMDDLGTALFYALPPNIAKKNRFGEKWTITDVEKSLDAHREKNSYLAIQYHLYEHPLYQYSASEDTTINLLVIGFGNYGHKFLDASLQAGQLHNKTLFVTVLADEEDKEIYLAERPELNAFFNVDGSCEDSSDSYGSIDFRLVDFDRRSQKNVRDTVERLLCAYCASTKPHYVFIALGDDRLNELVAKTCRKLSESCVVSYACEEKKEPRKTGSGLWPLFVNEDIRKSHLYAEVERMAFNTHLVWAKDLNVDYRSIKTEYAKAYNHDSCVSTVLAIKYKLHSIGIDLETDFNEAARLFCKALDRDDGAVLRDRLIWIEHRRWVAEKLCLGWRRITDLTECVNGATKDEKRKRHICIVRSRPDGKMRAEREKWDSLSDEELAQLDELDRLSIELHRLYADRAIEVRKYNLLSGGSVANIRALMGDDRKAMAAFLEWQVCMKGIWNGDTAKVQLYKSLKETFVETLGSFPEDRRASVLEEVSALETALYPVLASMEYRDWKKTDETLIDNIPFVLTYTEHATIVIPLASGNATYEFENVAVPTIVSPERVIYMCLVETGQDLRRIGTVVLHAAEYMDRKRLKAKIELILLYKDEKLISGQDKLLLQSRHRRIKKISQFKIDVKSRRCPDLKDVLAKSRSLSGFFAVEINETKTSRLLEDMGVYSAFPSFRFRSDRMIFHNVSGCEMLSYIRKTPYITVTDIVNDSPRLKSYNDQPEFFDSYMVLWKRYCSDISLWERVCGILNKNKEENDILASFEIPHQTDKAKNLSTYHYVLPLSCSPSVSTIVKALREKRVVGDASCVLGYTTDSCEVIIVDAWGDSAAYDKLFSNVYALMLPESVTIHYAEKRQKIEVIFDNLMVSSVQLAEDREAIRQFINEFATDGLIINPELAPNGELSFTYATRQVKELLTVPEKILEVYTYHRIKEHGYFDDVISISKPDKETTRGYGFDCIVTRGFQSLFVECKRRDDITPQLLKKLGGLAKNIGINATGVIIATPEPRVTESISDIERNNNGDIVQIFELNSINSIDETLMCIMDDVV